VIGRMTLSVNREASLAFLVLMARSSKLRRKTRCEALCSSAKRDARVAIGDATRAFSTFSQGFSADRRRSPPGAGGGSGSWPARSVPGFARHVERRRAHCLLRAITCHAPRGVSLPRRIGVSHLLCDVAHHFPQFLFPRVRVLLRPLTPRMARSRLRKGSSSGCAGKCTSCPAGSGACSGALVRGRESARRVPRESVARPHREPCRAPSCRRVLVLDDDAQVARASGRSSTGTT
jgi:hypothetical protein